MDATAILTLIKNHYIIATFVGVLAIGLTSQAVETLKVHIWYAVAIVSAGLIFAANGEILYFYAFCLGMATAFAEIISKFTDEPIKALSAPQAVLYHVLNGLVSSFALRILFLYSVPVTTLDKVKAVVIAGFGAMLLLRSKLFNVKVGGEDVSFGPEQIVKVFFRYMELAIDRLRAQARIQFVKATLDNIDFKAARAYTRTMLGAAQTLEDNDLKDIDRKLDEIAATPDSPQLKSYAMGFLLLNKMGEDVVARLFEEPQADWYIKAPEVSKGGGLISSFLPTKDLYYFAYGGDMFSKTLLKRLNWSTSDYARLKEMNPQRAILNGYSMAFDHPSQDGSSTANIQQELNSSVEGVLYKLPPSVLEFLDKANPGYMRREIEVASVDEKATKPITAQAYISEERRSGLYPTQDYLNLLIQGARERGLSPEYINKLATTNTVTMARTASA